MVKKISDYPSNLLLIKFPHGIKFDYIIYPKEVIVG